ncbi:DUF748 domain-containing protein [Caldimonas tepidiphila]|uniref:DUF748 domain-containing protein n=1 Tax=Caldimonas tepidiphila TaxID=2315841 RepID=UPI000E5ACEB1|nr:DUF748 domain-containing protein [Caldimonas tepidiphila]
MPSARKSRLLRRLPAAAALLAALYAVAGYELVPRLVAQQLPQRLAERLGVQATLGPVRFDPWRLALEARELQLRQPGGQPLLALQRLSVDLALSGLWQRRWTLDELRLEGLELHVEAAGDGRLNWDALIERASAGGPSGPLPDLLLRHASLQGKVALRQLGGAAPATAELQPLHIELHELATRPGAEARYRASATLSGGGTLQAQGSLSLQPLRSAGELRLDGLEAAAVWPLLRERLRLKTPEGRLAASARYAYDGSDEAPGLRLDALTLKLAGLALTPADRDAPLLTLATLEARDGRLDLAARRLAWPELALRDGAIGLAIGADGTPDWQQLAAPARATPTSRPAPAGKEAPPWRAEIGALRVERIALHAADLSRPLPLALDIGAIGLQGKLALHVGREGAKLRGDGLSLALERLALAEVGAARPLLSLDSVRVAPIALDSGRQSVSIGEVALKGGGGELAREPDGRIRLLDALRPAAAREASAPDAPPHAAPASPWSVALGRLRADGMRWALRDRGFEPPLAYGLGLDAQAERLDANAAGSPWRLQGRVQVAEGGTLAASGEVAADGSAADLRFVVDALALGPLRPLLARHTQLELRSGTLSGDAQLRLQPGEAGPGVQVQGAARVADLRLDEAGTHERVIAWKALQAEGIAFDSAPRRLAVQEVRLQQPAARLMISRERRLNLAQLLQAPGTPPSPTPEKSAPGDASSPPMPIRIDRIRVRDGTLDYADLSLVLPFSTRVTGFGGTVVGVSNDRSRPAQVQAAGEIAPYGSARVDGRLAPFEPRHLLDLRVRMDNVEMPPLSPYTVTFAGREVAEGRLWLDLDYRIEDARLLGRNDLRLSDFRLGRRVEAPGALDLPLDLAVALLSDEQGRIELSVPVEGDVGQPSFAIGSVVREAAGGVLRRVASVPFRALGRLLGAGGEDETMAEIGFDPGSDALRPQEREKLARLATVLAQRPQLKLLVAGPWAPATDAPALRERLVRLELARALGEELAAAEDPAPLDFGDERTRRALEALLARQAGEAALREFREAASRPALVPAALQPREARASASPHETLFERLVASWPLPEGAAQELAARRERAIREHLGAVAGVPAGRIEAAGMRESGDEEARPTVRLSLDAAAVAR